MTGGTVTGGGVSGWQVSAQAVLGRLRLSIELAGDDTPLALVGPNGSGKTTLLRMIAGAVSPARGRIRVGDAVVFDSERGIELPPEARRVGYVPQGYGLFPHLRAIDNVAFGLSVGRDRRSRAERHRAAQAMLDSLQCGHLSQRTPARLSGGEQQRVALARALLTEPDMLLLDEPLSALDVSARRAVRQFLAGRLRALRCPTIVVTHDVRDVLAMGATVCVLDQGQVVQRGELEGLRDAPLNDFVREFVGTGALPPRASVDNSVLGPATE